MHQRDFSTPTGISHRRRPVAAHPVAIMAVLMCLSRIVSAQTSACDLDASGGTNVVDVNRAVSMVLGQTPCTANVEGPNTCSIVTVQRVVNAALGQPCAVYNATTRTVTLSWLPSSSAGVVGYNAYRRSTPTGIPFKLNSATITATNFVDNTVQLGQTYYYSATSVNGAGNESPQSPTVTVVIPTN
jgi:hypothetical protein